jgi:hypothetical protein
MNMGVNLETVLAQVGMLARFSASASSQFQGPVPSTLTNPFSDSHAISTLTASNISVNHVDQVEMTTFQNEDTGGWS